uniref:CHCH domain-containing protein n=1 Tax=Corethrella appendiculata TaxID=1370023 RepID=U5EG08_9DIPT
MRGTPTLLKARSFQSEKIVPFQEILPLALKGKVSGKVDKAANVACLQEMAVLFACLKKNEFDESLCPKEISTFKNCYQIFVDSESAKKVIQQKNIIAPGRDLNSRQLNKYLKNYPNVKDKKY